MPQTTSNTKAIEIKEKKRIFTAGFKTRSVMNVMNGSCETQVLWSYEPLFMTNSLDPWIPPIYNPYK